MVGFGVVDTETLGQSEVALVIGCTTVNVAGLEAGSTACRTLEVYIIVALNKYLGRSWCKCYVSSLVCTLILS